MAPVRIVHIIPSLDRAGAEKQMRLLVERLPAEEFDVHVCALTRGGPLEAELQRAGVPVTVIGKRGRADPQAFWRLTRYLARLRPALVHSWLLAANAYGYAAARACGVQHAIASQRCVDPWKGWAELTVDRYLGRHVDRMVANSPAVRDFYVRHGLPAEKFCVIPNGVAAAAATATTRGQLLAELGLPDDSRLIGLVGRLWPQKRVKDAIWAAHGDRLRRFRDQVEIADKVHFLGARNDVPRWMPHFDVLWSTSGYEGQSNAILEAMAAGVPVVATDIPGTRDLVVPEETGYLVQVGHRAGFARWTNQLLDDAALAARLGQAARQRVASEFGIEAMLSRYVALYRSVLA